MTEDAELIVRGHVHPFVGRGALKLDKALRVFGVDVTGAVGMDIGAATGGFTDVLLQNGAKHVYAIDVGYGQLDWKIRSDERVTVLERTNARYLTHEQIPCVPDITVMDVSFISVTQMLDTIRTLIKPTGQILILIKPQFELSLVVNMFPAASAIFPLSEIKPTPELLHPLLHPQPLSKSLLFLLFPHAPPVVIANNSVFSPFPHLLDIVSNSSSLEL